MADQETQPAEWQARWFEQVRIANEKAQMHVPVGELGTHHWVASIFHTCSKFLPWHFDLQAFKIAMHHTAALCMRACHWADEVMEKRAAIVAEATAQAKLNQTLQDSGLPTIETAPGIPDDVIIATTKDSSEPPTLFKLKD